MNNCQSLKQRKKRKLAVLDMRFYKPTPISVIFILHLLSKALRYTRPQKHSVPQLDILPVASVIFASVIFPVPIVILPPVMFSMVALSAICAAAGAIPKIAPVMAIAIAPKIPI